MGHYIRLLGVAAISCAVLSGCDSNSSVLSLPTGASPAPPPTPQPTPRPTPQPTPQPPPATTFTVSGVVTELVDGHTVPIEGAHVEDSQRHFSVKTGPDGSYTIPGVGGGGAYIYFAKEGFGMQTRQFNLTGDTRLDITLVRNRPF
jgi:Carboxypeptidase regulatory-like domain